MNEVIGYLPEITGAAGYALGVAAEIVTGRHGDKREGAVITTWGVESNEVASEAPKTGLRDRLGAASNLLAPLALSACVAAGIAPIAWTTTPTRETAPATLQQVVDYDLTATPASAVAMRTFALSLEKTTLFKTETDYDINGDSEHLPSDSTTPAFGPAGLPNTVSKAIDTAYGESSVVQSSGFGSQTKHNGGVLIETDGESIGEPKAIEADAEHAGGIPIFIINAATDSDNKGAEFKAIAKATGGHYWQASSESGALPSVASVEKEIKPTAVTSKSELKNTNTLRVFDGLGFLAVAMLVTRNMKFIFKRKSNNPVTEEI